MATDVLTWYQVSAQGGHAGPASTTAYIHQLETAMETASRCARPSAWDATSTCPLVDAVFPAIGEGLLGERPPFPQKWIGPSAPSRAQEVGIRTREQLMWRLVLGDRLDAAAAACLLVEETAEDVLRELVEVMAQLRLVSTELLSSRRQQFLALNAYRLWARAARQPKYQILSEFLAQEGEKNQWQSLRSLWQDWTLCHESNFVSLMNPRPAIRLITTLEKAGVSKKQMLVLSAEGASPLASQIKAFRLDARPCEPRKGRAGHRWFFVPHGVDTGSANAATLSVVGLHWWMLILGSLLNSKGEI